MIWVDVTNPPHVLFFKDFIKNHETLVTSRDFGDLGPILESNGIEHTPVGRHGGKSPEDKLIESSKRVEHLAGVVSGKIDVAVSKQSVELPRVAFGLGVPAIQFIDNEHAEKQNRIVLPLCRKIIVPGALHADRLIEQGATESQILKANCIFEATQLKNFKPNPDVPKTHGLEDYIVIRSEPYMASYFKGHEITKELIERLKNEFQVVVLPRGAQEYNAKTLRNVDSLSLMNYAKAVLSGGGTMTREAALLGTPAISYYPGEQLGVDEFLIENGLLYHSTSVDGITGILEDIIDRKQKLREKAGEITDKMEDPFAVLEKEISNLAGQSS
jgi:predicted glycosyltransferase